MLLASAACFGVTRLGRRQFGNVNSFGKLLCVARLVGFGETRCLKTFRFPFWVLARNKLAQSPVIFGFFRHCGETPNSVKYDAIFTPQSFKRRFEFFRSKTR